MKKMRTLLHAFLLTGALALSLAACGTDSKSTAAGTAVAAYTSSSWADLTVASGDQQVTLMWIDNNAPKSSTTTLTTTSNLTYNVYYAAVPGFKKNGAGVTKVSNLTGTSFIHTGLKNNTPYYYVVTAVAPDGTEGVPSREASAMPQAAIPAAPSGIGIQAGNGQVTLGTGFIPVSNVVYNVYWSTATIADITKAGVNKIPNVSFPLVHNSLVADGSTTYYYVVTAQTASGESVASRQLAATLIPPALSPPIAATNYSAPQAPSALAGNQQVTISWSAATTPPTGALAAGQTAALSYTIYWWTDANANKTAIKNVPLVSSGYTHQSLVNGTTYHYQVAAVYTISAAGAVVGTPTETLSATVTVTPQAKTPAIPSGLSAAAQNQQVELAWTADNSGAAVTYNLYWSTDNATWFKISGISSSSFTQTGLQSGVTYYYNVTAQGAGESAPSTTVTVTL